MITQWYMFLSILGVAVAQNPNCDYYQEIEVTETYNIKSPRYPANYSGALECRWISNCPDGYNCRLDCPEVVLPQSTACMLDKLMVSKSGDSQLISADTYCGRGSITAVSTGQRITVGLVTYNNTAGGRFTCTVSAQKVAPDTTCRCGERKQNRIVGGVETGINEYKMMAGLVDLGIDEIKCGAVIISNRHVLTAAHCVQGMGPNIRVVVGEHDVTQDNESPATKEYRVQNVITHNRYNESNYDYDIAVVTTTTRIQFNDRVGPVCLPFKFKSKNDNWLTGKKVTILGWGTIFFGGPKSKVLMEVDVEVRSRTECQYYMPSITRRQICTLTAGKDACQDDSGGPLLYTDPATGLLFNVGIVSFGRFCASNEPGINTKVTALLDWIVAVTKTDYCVK